MDGYKIGNVLQQPHTAAVRALDIRRARDFIYSMNDSRATTRFFLQRFPLSTAVCWSSSGEFKFKFARVNLAASDDAN